MKVKVKTFYMAEATDINGIATERDCQINSWLEKNSCNIIKIDSEMCTQNGYIGILTTITYVPMIKRGLLTEKTTEE